MDASPSRQTWDWRQQQLIKSIFAACDGGTLRLEEWVGKSSGAVNRGGRLAKASQPADGEGGAAAEDSAAVRQQTAPRCGRGSNLLKCLKLFPEEDGFYDCLFEPTRLCILTVGSNDFWYCMLQVITCTVIPTLPPLLAVSAAFESLTGPNPTQQVESYSQDIPSLSSSRYQMVSCHLVSHT